MNQTELMQGILDAIEENLTAELSASELAHAAGYSESHFNRLFQRATGLSVAGYIVRRRLLHALWRLAQGERLIDVAQSYGFDTHAGFYKAFRREFGCSPSHYLRLHPAKPPCRVNLAQQEHAPLSRSQLRTVLLSWGLESAGIADFYYESSGWRSDNCWLVNGQLLLKMRPVRRQAQTHLEITRQLAGCGLELQAGIQALDGAPLVEAHGLFFYLTHQPGGTCLRARELLLGTSPVDCNRMGAALGRLHRALHRARMPDTCPDESLLASLRAWQGAADSPHLALPAGLYGRCQEALGALYPRLPVQLVHRDPNPSNFYARADQLTGLGEFELAARTIRLFDPCYAACALLSEVLEEFPNPTGWLDRYHQLLAGYDSVCPLTPEERAAVPWVMLAVELACAGYFSSLDRHRSLSENTVRLLRWLCAHERQLTL